MKKAYIIIALAVICSFLLVAANIVCALSIINSTCAPWEKVIAIFIVFACTNAIGLHYINFLHDLY